jgi:hypothetical protein
MIDADAVVEGKKDSMRTLKELHPDQPLEKMVPEANFELMRRSIQFMQKAAAELSVDELFDAYAVNAEEIFDSPPGEQQKAFAKAIKDAKDRSASRRELIEIPEDDNEEQEAQDHRAGRGLGRRVRRE